MKPNFKKSRPTFLSPFDLSRYELYQDLFWWYAKQDAYQSIVGGNGLL